MASFGHCPHCSRLGIGWGHHPYTLVANARWIWGSPISTTLFFLWTPPLHYRHWRQRRNTACAPLGEMAFTGGARFLKVDESHFVCRLPKVDLMAHTFIKRPIY